MTVNSILQNISLLPPEDRYVIAEILSKKVCELRHDQLHLRVQEAEENLKSGNVVSGI